MARFACISHFIFFYFNILLACNSLWWRKCSIFWNDLYLLWKVMIYLLVFNQENLTKRWPNNIWNPNLKKISFIGAQPGFKPFSSFLPVSMLLKFLVDIGNNSWVYLGQIGKKYVLKIGSVHAKYLLFGGWGMPLMSQRINIIPNHYGRWGKKS